MVYLVTIGVKLASDKIFALRLFGLNLAVIVNQTLCNSATGNCW